MSKIAVVYWSGTGNTEAMAAAVAEGAREKDVLRSKPLICWMISNGFERIIKG